MRGITIQKIYVTLDIKWIAQFSFSTHEKIGVRGKMSGEMN